MGFYRTVLSLKRAARFFFYPKAVDGNRTRDLITTNDVRYRLCHNSNVINLITDMIILYLYCYVKKLFYNLSPSHIPLNTALSFLRLFFSNKTIVVENLITKKKDVIIAKVFFSFLER